MSDEREPSPDQLLLTIDDVSRRLNISRAMVYRLIQHPSLKVVHWEGPCASALRVCSSGCRNWNRSNSNG